MQRKFKLQQNQFQILTQKPLSELLHLPHWEFKLYAFGAEKDREKLPDIELSCLAFDVMVTFEVVGGDSDE